MSLTQSFESRGVEYQVHTVTIKDTFIGTEDHGIFTCTLHLDGGVGGSLPLPMGVKDFAGYLKAIIRVTGAESWEKQKGKQVLMLSERMVIKGIASLDGERHFILDEYFTDQKETAVA